ncbi:Retrovirus-related Pol polyprotein from transposon 17.6 [Vitis vinifera]|uniref:Retrovirus-related Pol polyprotein from transposon 17.6 n=1 Tax=Vitis vinifera TaxID=29760 RepID=A0A438D3S6_VITVI|nr:Retrovirus-related Pol polyprotein from transposon 17.6 [Vitis vinifera]
MSARAQRVHGYLDHDVPLGLGFIPTEVDYRYMARLRKERVDEHGTFTEIGDIVDGAIPHGEYIDEMFAMSISQVNEEIQKQLSVGCLSVVEYPEWLANVVPVPKKDDKVRVYVDFRDLNKANFFGYNQIPMALEDMEKTSFITEWATYHYRVMLFGLKNVRSTYQRATTTLFHDMMHHDVEVYVDEMIVKSRDRVDHLVALERFFERIRQFILRLNPKKCTFGVISGKLLGYMVGERGIKADPDKIIVILDMPASMTEREIRGFLGRLQYISRFIAILIDIYEPIFRLLRKSQPTVWDDKCQHAFERIKEYLLSPPVLLPPTPGCSLLLYLSISDVALGCIPALVGPLIRWLVLLTEFDIHYVTQKSIRGSIVVDQLALLPVSDGRAIDDDFPNEDVVVVTSLSG